MSNDDTPQWYLLKNDDGSTFGPVTMEQLRQWATEAQISPLDKVSNDGKSWMKAPMLHDLGLDYLVEVSPDQYYGPTTLGAIREFLQMGEIHPDTLVTNCKDGTEAPLKDIPGMMPTPDEEEAARPVRTSIRLNLQKRIRELEEIIMEERRAREIAEHHIEKLEAKLAEISRTVAL